MSTIGEVAVRTGLRASAIRYYEAQGLLPVAARQGGKRVYDASVLHRISVIKLAKAAGFNLSEIRLVLMAVRERRPQAAWKGFATAKRAEIEHELAMLLVRKRVVAALGRCSCASLDGCGRAFADALAKYRSATRLAGRGRRVTDSPAKTGTVPEIVPATSKDPASGANSSQLARSRKLLKRADLRGKTEMAERLTDV